MQIVEVYEYDIIYLGDFMLKEYLEKDVKLNKKEFISILCLTIVISGIVGWLYEFIFYFINSGFKQFYMRGSNFLPWINIYAWGALLIILFTYKVRKKPLLVFLISAITSGILEYFSGYILYGKLGWTKCWDYNTEILNFGNINGYVCLRSVLLFGVSALLLMYVILPLLIRLVKSKHSKIVFIVSIVLCSIFLIDELYNLVFSHLLGLSRASRIYKSIGFKYLYFK